jgi:hypothetical protein
MLHSYTYRPAVAELDELQQRIPIAVPGDMRESKGTRGDSASDKRISERDLMVIEAFARSRM